MLYAAARRYTAKACEAKNNNQRTSAITVGLITFIQPRYLAKAFDCHCTYAGFCDVTEGTNALPSFG